MKKCGRCGQAISPAAPGGVCPSCAFVAAITAEGTEMSVDLPFPELANYEILEEIGQGGMGIVYKARQRNTERVVALKVILTGSLAGEKEVRRFRAEAQAVAKLRHQNIVTLFEIGHENGQHFFSMEYVEGESLLQRVRAKTLNFGEAAILVKKVAEAVNAAHEKGILHRDLKPANILIDKKGEPRITDFGLAQQQELKPDLTRSGTILGTPSYMPPEQALGKVRELSVCSDVYSVGATLYEAITGRPPFQADSALETLTQVVEIPPAAPRLLNPKIPKDLEVICLKCLRKQPLQRYASAAALADDLGRFLRKEPIEARPMGIFERNVAWCLRNPALATALATAALLVALLAVAAFLFRENLKQNNVVIAERSARLLESYLLEVSEPVTKVARNRTFAAWLKAPAQTNAIAEFLEAETRKVVLQPGLQEVFANWVALDPDGDMILRVTNGPSSVVRSPEQIPNPIGLTNRSPRDYFLGAMEKFSGTNEPRVHFSKVYKSVDDDFSKIGISCAIADPENPMRVAGVVSIMLKTFSTEDKRLGFGDKNVKTAILARWDQSAINKLGQIPKWVVWLHPGFQPGADAIPVKEDLNVEGRGNFLTYFDPARKVYTAYRGPWLAGLKPVPNTPFVVVVQSRDWILLFLGVALFCVVAAGAVMFMFTTQRRRRAKKLPPL